MAILRNSSGSKQRVVGTNDAGDDIATGAGNDTIFALGGNDLIFTSSGNDVILAGSGHDHVNGSSGNDTLYGGTGNDELSGGDGNDTFAAEVGFRNFGTDLLRGGAGFDTVVFDTGAALEVGGEPTQVAAAAATRGVMVSLVSTSKPGAVADFNPAFLDGNGTLAAEAFNTIRGQIIDSASIKPLGGVFNEFGNGVLDVVGTPSSVFADIEEFRLTEFADFFLDSNASHNIIAGGGDDFMSGGGGADLLDGGEGIDTALYRTSNAAVSISLLDLGQGGSGAGGEAQGDRLFNIENVFGSNFNDSIIGDAKNNTLNGFDGRDTLTGGNGHDTLDGGAGSDALLGGDGVDTASFVTSDPTGNLLSAATRTITLGVNGADGSAVVSQLSAIGNQILETDILRSIENVTGSNITERITGNELSNILLGRGGNDTLDGGSAGRDVLDGGSGVDTAQFIGWNVTLALAGTFETIALSAGLSTGSASLIRAPLGTVLSPAPAPTEIAHADLIDIENVIGSDFNSTITGNSGNNLLDGRGGNDVIAAGLGADTVLGGNGNDILSGGPGSGVIGLFGQSPDNDVIDGGGNTDTVDYSGNAGRVSVTLGLNNADGSAIEFTPVAPGNPAQAAGSTDTLRSIENVTGSAFGDTIVGNEQANVIAGGGGRDTMSGGGGNDTFKFANVSDSALQNGQFVNGIFQGDSITDFRTGGQADRIDLSGIDANTAAGGDQAFRFAGTSFTGQAGEVIVVAVGAADQLVLADINGDGNADFGIDLLNTAGLTFSAADFIL